LLMQQLLTELQPGLLEAHIRPLQARLRALLGSADGDSGDYCMEHAALLRGALGAEAAGAVERAVNDFDFDAALAKLRIAAEAKRFTTGEH
jgi:hypothetical protein